MSLMLLLWISGSVRAHPPADEPAGRSGVGVASVVSPLLQYQGRLTDPGMGEAVADGVYSMRFGLYDIESGGSPLWEETKNLSVQGGLFSTVLGDSTLLDQDLFNGQALWLGIRVDMDAEATPRQQVLPVAYALSLVPGAVVTGESDGQPALTLKHTGEGNALKGVTDSTNPNLTAIMGVNSGGGCGVAGYTISDESPAVSGWNDGAGPGVSGESVLGAGGHFSSTNSYGVYGYSGNSNGVRGEAMGSGAGVSGVNSGSGPGGYFSSSSGPALYADGVAEVMGDLAVGGNVEAGSVIYSSPRTHYFVVGSEGFVPWANLDYQNGGGTGGAYIHSGSGALVAPVHLPQGAVVTEFEAFFRDSSTSDMTITLQWQGFSGGYTIMAEVYSSGTPGYGSAVDTIISDATIDNTSYSYHVKAYSDAWSDTLRINAALITYTINEAP